MTDMLSFFILLLINNSIQLEIHCFTQFGLVALTLDAIFILMPSRRVWKADLMWLSRHLSHTFLDSLSVIKNKNVNVNV